MGTVTTISPDAVSVQPGGEAECEVRVRNTGRIVDQFSFEALGEAAPWTSFEPSSVSLFPDAEGVARLVFRPPRSSAIPAGSCAVGVRVRSKEDPRSAVVEELTLEVGRLADTFAELIPRTGRGSRRVAYHLAVDNRGNSTLEAKLSAADPDDRLGFTFNPPSITAEPGMAAFTKVVARPLKRFLRGPDVSHPFQVRVEPDGEPALVVDGSMLQQAVIPKWLPRFVLGLLIAGWATAVLWLALLKPKVEDTARDAANDALVAPLQQITAQLAAVHEKVGLPPPAPIVPGGREAAAATTTTTAPTTVTTVAPSPPPIDGPGTPFDRRLQVTPDAQTVSYTVPDGEELSLTDIFLQNPQGDSGLLRIQRGATTLLTVRLENFRDLDYHFVSPLVFSPGQTLTLAVECANPAPAGPDSCTPAATYNGFVRPAGPPTTTTTTTTTTAATSPPG